MDTLEKWFIKQNQPQITAELETARRTAIDVYVERLREGIEPIVIKRWFRTYIYVYLGIVTDFSGDGESDPATVYANVEGRLFFRLVNGQFVEFTNKNTPLHTAQYIAYDLVHGSPPSPHGM